MAKSKIDAVVAGHICLDILPAFQNVSGNRVEHIFKPGSLLVMGPASVSSGGPVSNTGLALRRLGISVALMGKCGDDFFGHLLLECLKKEAPGAEMGMGKVKGEPTSYTVALTPPGIDRIFLHCPGTNNTFTSADVNLSIVKQARLFHFGYPPLMKRIYSNGGRDLTRIFRMTHKTGATTSLDMSLPDPNSISGHADWKGILKRTLPYVDLFLPSGEELLYMIERDRFNELRKQAGTGEMLDHFTTEDVSRIAETCLSYGAKIVLVKLGKLGACVRTAGADRLKQIGRAQPHTIENWADREIWQPSYRVKKLVSATGSGDSAIAGFLAGYLNGQSVEMTMHYCCSTGYQNVQVLDAVSGIRNWAETTAMVKRKLPVNDLRINMSGWRFSAAERQFAGPADQR